MKFLEPESQTLEFKAEWSDTAKKTMIAFANDMGGVLQIGVADNGELVGCNFDLVERSARRFARDGVEPSMSALLDIRKQVIDGKVLATILVAPGTRKPYGLRGKLLTEGGVYIRLGGQTVPATLDEVVRIIQRGDPRTWESRPSNDTNLTFNQSERIFDNLQVPFSETHRLGYGLLNRDREFTNLALLLSDQNPFRVIVNTYAASGQVETSDRFSGSILQQWISVRERLEQINTPFIDKETDDFARREIYPWPKIALREALTNTLAHRDYSSQLQVAINIHPDVITFFTPGGIPPELTLEEALMEGASFCRNEKLTEIFMRLRWMEKAGTGFGDIFKAYSAYPQKPKLQQIVRSFLIELPRVNTQQSGREAELLRYVKNSPNGRTRAEIETYLKLSSPTIFKLLRKLKANGQVAVEGKGPSTRYLCTLNGREAKPL